MGGRPSAHTFTGVLRLIAHIVTSCSSACAEGVPELIDRVRSAEAEEVRRGRACRGRTSERTNEGSVAVLAEAEMDGRLRHKDESARKCLLKKPRTCVAGSDGPIRRCSG